MEDQKGLLWQWQFLPSEQSGFITGQTLFVDGGS
jgi:NAD(P)-dependent dehydrogenase (short-subunit alcohol dehydrogenase family)